MKTLKITYPIITFSTFTLDVKDEECEEILEMSCDEKAKYIRNMVEEHEPENIDWIHEKLSSAIELGFASIKKF